jgi:predicted dinucleotide-binding enzyme
LRKTGEEVAKLAKNAKVVKAFNTCGWKIMIDPRFGNEKADMYIAGDDAGGMPCFFKFSNQNDYN